MELFGEATILVEQIWKPKSAVGSESGTKWSADARVGEVDTTPAVVIGPIELSLDL
jgi:hypothetical protein